MLDPVIHQATRLRIMAALFRNREASFTRLRDALDLTDGNLGSHAAALEKAGYIDSRRVLSGLSFEVRYRITPAGSAAFVDYTQELQALLSAPAELDAAPLHEEPDARHGREERDRERDEARGAREA
ncbi:MAG TPA: transcriptional regulator [Candidatus Thermoplasmatota archaeon]|nr:transcriptional regulator [Candidatus Thermoplasmatota archaeon]